MAAAVSSSVARTRMLVRGIVTGRAVRLRLGGASVGISGLKRRYHASSVLQAIASSMPDVSIPVMPVTDFAFRDMKNFGDRPALINGLTGESYTYPQARDAIWRVASGLARHGVRQNDVVMIVSENCVEYILTFHAVLSLGATVTVANPIYLTSDIVNQAKDSNTKFIVSSQKCADKSVDVKDKLSQQIKKIFTYGEEQGCVPFSSLLADDGSECPLDVSFDPRQQVAVLPYSSGTTGMPKGVILTHFAQVANSVQSDSPLIYSKREGAVQLGLLPFYHIYALLVTLISSLSAGQTTVVVPGFDPRVFLQVIPQYKVTLSYIVPPIVMFLNKHPMVAKADLSSLNRLFSGAASLGREMVEEFHNKNPNCLLGQGYGLTETAPVITATPDASCVSKPASVGAIVPNTELKLVNVEDGKECAAGDHGEICVRGPQLMLGYLNNPTATAATIDSDGWLHTGDIGYLDDDNYVYISDRLKELIKYKGLQVPPAELEAILCSHPSVADAGVIGIPDADGGEVPRAYVALKHGTSTTASELKKFVEGQVVAYKRLRGGVEFLPEIPRSAAGKILRRQLKELAKSPTTDASTFSAAMME